MRNMIREKILDASQKRMLKFGYRKVTMDEIASDLKMSKSTIYKFFTGKDKIANALFERLKEKIEFNQKEIKKKYLNPTDVISNTVSFLQKELTPWFKPFMSDIETELTITWEDFTEFRKKQILDLESLIKTAIKKGLFRNINPAIAVKAYLGAIENVIDPEILEKEKLSFSDAISQVMDIWSNGVAKTRKA